MTDARLDRGEQQAEMGAQSGCSDPSSHRQADYEDPVVLAGEVIMLADLLLRLLKR